MAGEITLKCFYIEGNGAVTDVGLRPSLISGAKDFNVKVFAKNLPEHNEVQVIVEGNEKDIETFRLRVKQKDLRSIGKRNSYEVTKLKDYRGCKPDFAYFTNALVLEQVSKGSKSLENVESSLKSIDNKMDKLPKEIAEAIRSS